MGSRSTMWWLGESNPHPLGQLVGSQCPSTKWNEGTNSSDDGYRIGERIVHRIKSCDYLERQGVLLF